MPLDPQNDSVIQETPQAANEQQTDTSGQARRKRIKREKDRKKKKQQSDSLKAAEAAKARAAAKLADTSVTARAVAPPGTVRDTSAAPSLFTGHELTPGNLRPEPLPVNHAFWLFTLLFTAFALYVSLRVIYGKRFKQEIGAFFTSRLINQMMREEYGLSNRVSMGLSLLYFMIFSLFLYQVATYYGHFDLHKKAGPELYFKVFGGVVVLQALKLLVVRMLGKVFRTEAAVNEYIFTIFLYNKALGLFLFPVTISIAFVTLIPVPYFIIAGWIIVSIVLVYRTLRALASGIQMAGISKYYLFLYLCTLELLPLIVLIKVFISQSHPFG